MMSPSPSINNPPASRLPLSSSAQPLSVLNTPTQPAPASPAPLAPLAPAMEAAVANDQTDYLHGAEAANLRGANVSTGVNSLVIDNTEQPAPAPAPPRPDHMMNDDIRMSRPREKSLPKQQSLQKDCQAHSATPKAFKEEPKPVLSQQRSLDRDDPELLEIHEETAAKGEAAGRGRRDSHTSVRYRPETPRTVTPVRFTPTPRLPNKGVKSPEPKLDKSLKSPEPQQSLKSPTPSLSQGLMSPEPAEAEARVAAPSLPQPPVRNVSDSGISVASSTASDPADPLDTTDDSAGKIVAESMLKIEAQMKRILEHENKTKSAKENCKPGQPSAPSSPAPISSPITPLAAAETSQDAAPEKLQTKSASTSRTSSGMVKTGSFEVMEDFEEAPQEFDLGISSYSISHPIESLDSDLDQELEVEMEKTPVPEIVETDEPPKFPYEETPYTVSTPSGTMRKDGTLRHDRKPNTVPQERPAPPPQLAQRVAPEPHTGTNGHTLPSPGQQQMPGHSGNIGSPFMGEMPGLNNSFFNPAFNNMGMGMAAPFNPMFEDQFPAFPHMFESPFQQQQQQMFNNFNNQQQQQQPPPQPPQQQRANGGERIIPIQVIKANNDTADILVSGLRINNQYFMLEFI